MNNSIDVVVIGNVGIDTNIFLPGAEIDFDHEANFTLNLDTIGQAGGYASRGYNRLGKQTAFIGYVGDDFSGAHIRQEFEREGIDTQAMFIDPAGTSRSVNILYPDGRRKNFYDGKSHMELYPDLQACQEVLRRASQHKPGLAHFNIPNWARHLLPITRQLGLIIACDLQDVINPLDPYRQDFIHYADFLFFSAANYSDPAPLFEAFLRLNEHLLIVCGLGAQGCAMATSHHVQFFPPVQLDTPVVDTNGAGDSLAVGFLTSYVCDGFSLADSIQRGQIAARYTCSLKGTSSGMIDRQTLDSIFRKATGS